MTLFQIENKDIKRYEAELQTFARKALPFASKNTVNRIAFQARREWQSQISEQLIERNAFTRNSIRVETAKTLNIRRQAAVVGSIAPYMEDTEFGGTKRGTGEGVPIPTGYSAGQRGQRPRTRLPRKPNKLENIRLSRQRPRKARSKLQENFLRVRQAAESGNRYVYLDLRRGPGIFRVEGRPDRARIRLVHDLTRRSVNIPATPTLQPAIEATRRAVPTIYRSALVEQLRRYGLFRGRV